MEEDIRLPTQQELIESDAEFLPDDRWEEVDIADNLLDVTEQYARPSYTLSLNGVPFAPLGGIHGLTGLPGNGKTFLFTQFIVAVLSGACGPMRYKLSEVIPQPRVLYIDTEMEKGNTQLVNLRVYEMMGWQFGVPHEEFRILWLREEEKATDRWRKTLKAIYELQPNVVFLDGLLDVIGDFNNNVECAEIIYKCMKVASHYGISLWCLIHLNPGSTKMVGHSGSILERKMTDGFKVAKTKTVDGRVRFKVSQFKARGKDVDDWEFTIEDGGCGFGLPKMIGSEEEPEVAETAEGHTVYPDLLTMEELLKVQLLITSHDGETTRDVVDGVKDLFNVGFAKATKILSRAVELGILARAENKRYYLPDRDGKQDELPF